MGIDGHHQVFHTGPDGLPEPAVEFHRPTYDSTGTIDSAHPYAPKPGKPFDPPPGALDPHTRYDVVDTNGHPRGRFYTDADGNIRWADVESGRISRTHPDADNLANHHPGAEVHLRQRFEPGATAPEGVDRPERFDGATERVVRQKSDEPFLTQDRTLEPNSKYVVESEYRDGKKKPVMTRAVYWTDGNGDIAVAEHFRPHNPDLNNPRPNTVYNVDDGRFVYQTGPEINGETDTVSGTGNDLRRADSVDLPRRDESAQKESADLGPDSSHPRSQRNDGGHIVGNQFTGPGELVNMISQWRPQNQGWKLANADHHWAAMERDLADLLGKGGKVEQFSVFPLRDAGDRVPHTIQVRWVETAPDGTQSVHLRSFTNQAPNAATTT